MEKQRRLRTWLVNLVESGEVDGLEWLDPEEKTMCKIPWKHESRNDWCPETAAVFTSWAKFTGKYVEGVDQPDYKMFKTRLRCAFNKAPDIEEVPELREYKGTSPYRVYRILNKDRRVKPEDVSVSAPQSRPGVHAITKMLHDKLSSVVDSSDEEVAQPTGHSINQFQPSGNTNEAYILLQSTRYCSSLRQYLFNQQAEGFLCDLLLSSCDGVIIPVHANIMCAASRYFRTKVDHWNIGNSGDTSNGCMMIQLPTIKGDVMKNLVKFVYMGEFEIPRHQLHEMLDAATQVDLDDLRILCEHVLRALSAGKIQNEIKPANQWHVPVSATSSTIKPPPNGLDILCAAVSQTMQQQTQGEELKEPFPAQREEVAYSAAEEAESRKPFTIQVPSETNSQNSNIDSVLRTLVQQPARMHQARQTPPNSVPQEPLMSPGTRPQMLRGGQASPQPIAKQTLPTPVIPQPLPPQPIRSLTLPQPMETQTFHQPIRSQSLSQPMETQTSNQPIRSQAWPHPFEAHTLPRPIIPQGLSQTMGMQMLPNPQTFAQRSGTHLFPQPIESQAFHRPLTRQHHQFAVQPMTSRVAETKIPTPSPVATVLPVQHLSSPSIFRCRQCKKTFSSERLLRLHTQLHAAGKLQQSCETCGRSFVTAKGLLRHKKMWHESGTQKPPGDRQSFECHQCGEKFDDEVQKVLHVVRHYDGKNCMLHCPECRETFDNVSMLNIHIESTHRPSSHVSQPHTTKVKRPSATVPTLRLKGPLSCTICGDTFTSRYATYDLRKHMTYHTGIKPIECRFCNKTFRDYSGRSQHEKRIHKRGPLARGRRRRGDNELYYIDVDQPQPLNLSRHDNRGHSADVQDLSVKKQVLAPPVHTSELVSHLMSPPLVPPSPRVSVKWPIVSNESGLAMFTK